MAKVYFDLKEFASVIDVLKSCRSLKALFLKLYTKVCILYIFVLIYCRCTLKICFGKFLLGEKRKEERASDAAVRSTAHLNQRLFVF